MIGLSFGGIRIPDAEDLVRRYLGLRWSGGNDETWAWRYYDTVPDLAPERLDPVDVMVSAALGAGPRPAELVWFWTHREAIDALLTQLPADVTLQGADDQTAAELQQLPGLVEGSPVTLSTLTKVLHRKRPALVPLFDRAVLGHYRTRLVARTGAAAWPQLLALLGEDLQRNDDALRAIATSVRAELTAAPTTLRIADVAIWMHATRETAR